MKIKFTPISLLLILALLWCRPAFADGAHVQSASAEFDPGGASRTVTFGGNTTAHNMLVGGYDGDGTLTCTDSQGNTWATVASQSGLQAICVAYDTAGGTADVVTFSISPSSGNPVHLFIMEISGSALTSAFDQTCQDNAFVANESCATGSTSQAGEIVIAIARATGAGPTAGTGFTVRQTLSTNYIIEDKHVSSIGVQTCDVVNAEAASRILCATFKDASGVSANKIGSILLLFQAFGLLLLLIIVATSPPRLRPQPDLQIQSAAEYALHLDSKEKFTK